MNGKQKTGLERTIVILILLVAVLLITLTALAFWYNNATPTTENIFVEVLGQRIEYAKGISIDGVDVSNMTIEEARPLVQAAKPKPLGKLSIQANGQSIDLDLSSLEPRRDYESILQQALLFGNDGDGEQRKADKERIALNGEKLNSPLKYDASPLKDQVAQIAAQLSVEAKDASVRLLTPDEQKERGITIDTSALVASETPGVQESIQNLFEYVEELPGSKVDADALMTAVQASIDELSIDQPVQAQTVTVEPMVKLSSIKYDMVEIARASSSFAKSPYNNSNRMFNINKAAEAINGSILEPGESFSCNGVIGPRSTSTGWKEAGAIKDGQSVQETGGGICQVSSTVFNAVLKADLKVVDRSPHSWPLSYLPAGQDATISTGGPDFVFENNRETPVILVAEADLDKKAITIIFYGVPIENQDYDEIKLVSERTGTTSQPATQYTTVKSMRAGTSNVIRQGRSGSSYDTYKEYYKDGELIRREKAYSTKYRALASIIERGPAAPKRVEPAPATTVTEPVAQEPAPAPAASTNVDDVVFDIPEE